MSETPTPSWDEYLDAVEAAALDVRDSLLQGRSPQLPALPPPAGSPAPHHEPRRAEVAVLVDEVTRFLAEHQAAVGDRLAALPHHPPRGGTHHHETSLGTGFDLRG